VESFFERPAFAAHEPEPVLQNEEPSDDANEHASLKTAG